MTATITPGPVTDPVTFILDASGSTLSADVTINVAAMHALKVFVDAAAVTGGGPSTLSVLPAVVAPDNAYAKGPGLSRAIAGQGLPHNAPDSYFAPRYVYPSEARCLELIDIL